MIVASLNQNVLPEPIDRSERQVRVYGNLVLSGNYGGAASHGDVLALGALGIPSDQPPSELFVYEEPTAGNAATGYTFIYARGTNQNTGQLIVMQNAGAGAPFVELTQGGAYPAALTAATANLKFIAHFPFDI